MQEMVAEFEQKLIHDAPELFNLYSDIKNKLIEEYGDSKTDIETMLSVISGIVMNPNPTALGPFVFYYISINYSEIQLPPDKVENAKKLQKQIEDYIKSVCKVNTQDDVSRIYKKSYVPLFRHMDGHKKNYDGIILTDDWKAYTTNYDSVFEDFWDSLQRPYDHFEQTGGSAKYSFTAKQLGNDHTFSKLHGSLNWTREVDTHKLIKKTTTGFNLSPTSGQIMLFPIQQKDLYLQPWFTLLQDLKVGLSAKEKWYVVGYAFNDEFIRNMFEESLERSDVKLVIIDPKAEEIKKKFSELVRDKIGVLPIKFGEASFGWQFADYSANVKTVTVSSCYYTNSQTSDKIIKIQSSSDIKSITTLSNNIDQARETTINSRSAYLKIKSPNNAEIKFALKIMNDDSDKIALKFLHVTGALRFVINYGAKKIGDSVQAEQEYEKADNAEWTKHTIKLDKNDLL